jgi:hypothetical protein
MHYGGEPSTNPVDPNVGLRSVAKCQPHLEQSIKSQAAFTATRCLAPYVFGAEPAGHGREQHYAYVTDNNNYGLKSAEDVAPSKFPLSNKHVNSYLGNVAAETGLNSSVQKHKAHDKSTYFRPSW